LAQEPIVPLYRKAVFDLIAGSITLDFLIFWRDGQVLRKDGCKE